MPEPVVELPVERIVAGEKATPPVPEARLLGRSREGREVVGYRFGRGALRLSLIAGCHADEPVGPAMLDRLAAYLGSLPEGAAELAAATWCLVPHVNPDGEARNAPWTAEIVPLSDHSGAADRGYDLLAYVRGAVRELPGDDVEFGFPRSLDDTEARPENRAVAAFLAESGPFHLHATFHGMAFAAGPWFLLEAAWAERSAGLRRALARRVGEMGYRLHDVDRKGEKGFVRIAEGFSTRPDSRKMVEFFLAQGDPATAARFRPSSMEHVRSLGGDPLTLVSEMPLFLMPHDPAEAAGDDRPPLPIGTEGKRRFDAWMGGVLAAGGEAAFRAAAARGGIRPMPIRDQMRLQLAFLNEGLRAVA